MEKQATAAKPVKEQHANELNGTSLQHAIDQVSLEQALRDFEVANARVIDLTRRLIASDRQIVTLQSELDESAVALRELEAVHNGMRNSFAFRLASKMWNVRSALRS